MSISKNNIFLLFKKVTSALKILADKLRLFVKIWYAIHMKAVCSQCKKWRYWTNFLTLVHFCDQLKDTMFNKNRLIWRQISWFFVFSQLFWNPLFFEHQEYTTFIFKWNVLHVTKYKNEMQKGGLFKNFLSIKNAVGVTVTARQNSPRSISQ